MATLYTPTVVVNGNSVYIKPNSLKYTEGFGERVTRVASGGGARKQTINSENIETQYSKLTFILYTTGPNVASIRDWQSRFDANTVEWLESGESRSMTNAIIMNDPEVNIGVEGEVEVTFSGDPVV